MKKSLIALAALPVLAYPAAAWYLGTRVEVETDRQYADLAATPNVRILDRRYDRGIFDATEVTTVEMFGDLARASRRAAAKGEGAQSAEEVEPLRLVVRTSIRHGPWVGGRLAAAEESIEVSLGDGASGELARVFGDKAPLAGHGVLNFDGSGVAQFRSPAVAAELPAREGAPPVLLSWQGLDATVEFSPGMTSFKTTLAAPLLEVSSAKGDRLVVRDIALHADQARVFPEEPMLLGGKQQVSIAAISISGPELGESDVELGGVLYEVDMPVHGDYLDVISKIGTQVLRVGPSNFGPAHFDMSFQRMHARTALQLYKKLVALMSDPGFEQAQAAHGGAFDELRTPALAMLTHGPEVRIDRLSFNSPGGEASAELRAALPGITAQDLENPFMLVARLDVGARVALPEAMLFEMSRQAARTRLNAAMPGVEFGPRHQAEADRAVLEKLALAERQGFVERANQMLSTRVEFTHGKLTVNGRPVNPGDLQ